MTSATIKLFLPRGDAKSLRTAEISNWTGKAIAAPRTEFEELLEREELTNSGVYILIGTDPESGSPHAYIGEAEVIRDRLKQPAGGILFCRAKGAEARGHRTPDGFVVLKGSTAVPQERQQAHKWPASIALRNKLIADQTLIQRDGFYVFTKDVEFSSPSAAAAVVQGGSANGLTEWKTADGKLLRDLEEQEIK